MVGIRVTATINFHRRANTLNMSINVSSSSIIIPLPGLCDNQLIYTSQFTHVLQATVAYADGHYCPTWVGELTAEDAHVLSDPAISLGA